MWEENAVVQSLSNGIRKNCDTTKYLTTSELFIFCVPLFVDVFIHSYNPARVLNTKDSSKNHRQTG